MDLQTSFQDVVTGLDKRESELNVREALLVERETQVDNDEQASAVKTKELEQREKDVKYIEDVEALKALLDEQAKDQSAKAVEQKRKDTDLKRYENKLYEIKVGQDKKEEELQAQTTAQAKREKEYQEELKTNFTKNFMSSLLK